MAELEETVARLDRRPGFKIVAHCEVGLPVFSVVPLVTLREQSSIGVLEEAVLKCIDCGVDRISSLVAFLGVPTEIVSTQLGALLYDQVVRNDAASDNYSLTPRGVTRLAELSTTRVSKKEIRSYVDGLTRELLPLEQVDLYSGRQLEAFAIPAVTPNPRSAPRASEISVSQLNRIFSLHAGDDQSHLHAVKVEGYVRRTSLMFRRSIAIAFKPDSGRGMAIAFAVDGRISNEHEVAFSVSGADQRSGLFKELFDPAKRRAEILAARKHIQEFAPAVLNAGPPASRKPSTLRLPTRGEAKPYAVRTLSSYEHAPLLSSSMGSAETRLLIVSPWIRRQVVDDDFLRRLAACLERNVQVTIAFGFGRDRNERDEDRDARSKLDAMTQVFKNFTLIRKSNIHAKVLLVDDKFFITTSFNWLSFRGDPNQPLREEEGTYVEGKELVDEYFERLSGRLLNSKNLT